MRASCPAPLLREHCRTLGLPFEDLLGGRVAVGCIFCHRFDGAQQVILAPDELGEWSGQCPTCDRFAGALLDAMKTELRWHPK